ncbi:hypothetical protein ABZ652_01090 [Micromonospora chalcea]|uniref:DUF6907 domain-containing protein n=1 Tax=Micromonospora chalcea TaxID=1874 RepID=UPI0033D7AD87
MNIIASASVPPANRLIDSPTVDIAAIRAAGDDRYAQGYADGLHRALTARPAACPPWCSNDHRAEITTSSEVDALGFSLGLVHERVMVELTGLDPSTTTDPATVSVYVECTSERGEQADPPRVVVTVAEGTSGEYAGGTDVQGWTGSPAEARALAAALLAGAALVDPA